ncbi:hypothetical protein SAY87_026343 [Trapa incisa]|uniref:UBC core domain-containing protein n=1 Tax=Trapa incisa TaxID=236973 RepID=A0AAN7JCZ5_9MYRT|nr:hypothetical protein SAY87_026343 [Trapa incisa]
MEATLGRNQPSDNSLLIVATIVRVRLNLWAKNMSSPNKGRGVPHIVSSRMMSDYNVVTNNDVLKDFNVEFHGRKESLYEGGVWKVHIELPESYPYHSPSVGFITKIYHPNVDQLSGSVCLNVINQKLSPMLDECLHPSDFPVEDLLNVFEVFLPQLLLYPNPSDPLNDDAASLLMTDQKQYNLKVKDIEHFC